MRRYYRFRYTFKTFIHYPNERQPIAEQFTVVIYLRENNKDAFISFSYMEQLIQQELQQYHGKCLNDIIVINNETYVLENFLGYLQLRMNVCLANESFLVCKMELYTNPTQVCGLYQVNAEENRGEI